MSQSIEILEKQLELLEIERQEDLRLYREQVLKRSLKERVEKGKAWYPAQLIGSYLGTGDRVVVEIVRDADEKAPNSLQAGSMVALFGMREGKEAGHVGGVVHSIRKNRMKIVLGTQDFPHWLQGYKLGVNLDFDDKSYRDMLSALKATIAAKNDRLSELRELLIGPGKPSFSDWEFPYKNIILNDSQNHALRRSLEANDVALIHGPPGTGKTTTLVQTIMEVLKREHQVLICAPSNTAVDLLTLRCAQEGARVLRLGNPARVDEDIHYHTLDETIARHEDYPALKKLRKEVEALYKQAGKFKRKFGREEHRQRRETLNDARDFKRYAKTLEDYILHQVLDTAQIIACTLTGAAHKYLYKKKFHTVFIDEAAQALAPSCWIPLAKATRVIFAGDHQQLPPTVKSFEAEKGGLGKSLFEMVMEKEGVATMLETQYRMHQDIMGFSSHRFYSGKLKAAEGIGGRGLGGEIGAVEFVDTAGCGFSEKKNDALSTYNKDEAALLLKHLALLINQLETQDSTTFEGPFSIGIISPYKAQITVLKDLLVESPMLLSYEQFITINTVDGFQGQERDVIYISLVRSNDKGEIGFLKDMRRMNVALTRARKKLVVIGDSATLGQNKFYQAFLDYAEKIGAYRSAWELMEEE